MKYTQNSYFIVVLLLFGYSFSSAQDLDEISISEDRSNLLNDDMRRFSGNLNHSLPIDVIFTKQTECAGYITYGNDKSTFELEGDCTDSTFTLYEFDKDAHVSAIIKGTYVNNDLTVEWTDAKSQRRYPIKLRKDYIPNNKLRIFETKDSIAYDQVIFWDDHGSIAFFNNESQHLNWSQYICPHAKYACTLYTPKNDMHNLSISDKYTSIGSKLFEHKEDISVMHQSDFRYDNYYSFEYPKIGTKKFDDWADRVIKIKIEEFLTTTPTDEDFEPTSRFKEYTYNDFFITIATEEIISGYFTFYNSRKNTAETLTFLFDRQKKSFKTIREIWKKDFNFSYYLKSAIKDKKRKILKKENGVSKRLVEETAFNHYVLQPNGILFFTDHNTFFGRRSILLPFDEIGGFIENKTIQNFLKRTSNR